MIKALEGTRTVFINPSRIDAVVFGHKRARLFDEQRPVEVLPASVPFDTDYAIVRLGSSSITLTDPSAVKCLRSYCEEAIL